MSQVSSLLGQYERELEAANYKATGNNSALDKDAFLRLLVTQLENQDPLNPMDDKEFIAQLAQFSSLEQMNNIAEGINNLVSLNQQDRMLGAVGFIGKEVVAAGDTLSKEEESISKIYYSLEDTAKEVYVNIFDSFGNIIYSTSLGSRQPGEYQFTWDGKDFTGKEAANGVYSVTFAAEGVNGNPVLVDTEVSGKVSGIQNTGSGTLLRLEDGRVIDFNNVKEIVSEN
ncbi:MAG: flagellar basal-body rod modification protein FlgD [Desulfonauticus sp.]|jgi:flagellar basal-body rod modification protein FlgD|nr:MAG: Flagellar hook capping protein [Desulfonauticus sp. 38_4375]MDK2922073.1 flagellar basal-body rod modification protein FlgD [Desulfonauticus sp.]